MKQITIFEQSGSYMQLPLMEALCEYKTAVNKKSDLSPFEKTITQSIKLYINSYNQKTYSPCTRIEKLDQRTINHLINGDFYHIEFAGLQYIFFGNDSAANAYRHFIAKMYKKAGVDNKLTMHSFQRISPKCIKIYEFLHVKAPLIYLVYRSYINKETKYSLMYNLHPDYFNNSHLDVCVHWYEKNKENNHSSQFIITSNINIDQFTEGNFEAITTQKINHFKDTSYRLGLIFVKLFVGKNHKDLIPLHFAQQLLDQMPDANKNE